MSQLSIQDLFTPAPSGIGGAGAQANIIPTTATTGSWYAQLLANANTLGLVTTAWQSGSPSRTIIAIMSWVQSLQDVIVSTMAQGGFLDFAASGTVSYTDTEGNVTVTPVSPDPSVSGQNPNGNPTWLDVLAGSVYNVTRVGAQAASGLLNIVNTSGTTPSTYAPGQYHVQNGVNQATYSNLVSLTIPPSSVVGTAITAIGSSSPISITTASSHGLSTGSLIFIQGAPTASLANGFWAVTVTGAGSFTLTNSVGGTGGSTGTVYTTQVSQFAADLVGPNYGAATGQVNTTITTNNGIQCWNFGPYVGIPFESNTALAARCRLKLQALSPNGAKGAYAYFALTANQILQDSVPSRSLVFGNITQAQVTASPVLGQVTTVVANANVTPATSPTLGTAQVPGIVSFPITAASNANPIVITADGHGLTNGTWVTITGVLGNSNANGTWMISNVATNTFSIPVAGNGTYTGGGQIDGGDLGQVDYLLQSLCVPDGIVALTQSALVEPITITGNVTVPFAQVTAYGSSVQSAIATYFQNLAIGGLQLVNLSYGLPIDVVIGILFDAGKINNASSSFVINISGVQINGSSSDLVYTGTNYIGVVYPYPCNLVISGA
jgi:hypothetical protein